LSSSWASRSHLGYLEKTDAYKIVALQNSSKASAQKAVDKYKLGGEVACYDNSEALARDPDVDMVVVSVKVPEHYQLVKPALEAGKDVFVEWPLAANLAQAEELTKLAAAKKVKNVVGLQARHNPSIRAARDMVARGELGRILGTTMLGSGILFGATATPYFEYAFPLENGANLLTIPFGHAVDAMCYVLGDEFESLQATLANNRPQIPILDDGGNVLKTLDKTAHDYVSVSGTLQKGGVATVVYQGGMSSTGKNFYWEINGTKGSLVFEADNGHVQMFHPSLKFVKAEEGAVLEEVPVEVAADWSYNVGRAWDAFVGKGSGPVTTFEDALLRHRMIEAIYRSDERGTRESYI